MSTIFSKISQHEKKATLSTTVMNELMKEILEDEDGKIEYLPSEHELASIFSVSRITIREAIRGLEERGFVERKHGKGVKVINKSVEVATNSLTSMILRSKADNYHLLEVRKIIELQTVRLAALRADETDLNEMKHAIEKMNNTDTSDEEYHNSDLLFHVLIARASKNPILESFMNAIQPLILDMIKLTLERPEQTGNFHKNIFRSLVEKDPDKAEESMKEHLEATEKMIEASDLNNH